MIPVDTGPLVALLDKGDSNHNRCVAISKRLPPEPLLTTWPCFTEAMYLLGAVGGYPFQHALWQLRQTGRLTLHSSMPSEIDRMFVLMEKYKDTPMDLADASLVALAEGYSFSPLFTIDSHFYIYRLQDGSPLEIIQ